MHEYVLTTNREQGYAVVAIVISRGKRSTYIRYLKSKFLFANLSKIEMRIFLSLSEILNNPLWVAILTKVSEGTSKKTLRKIIDKISSLGYENITKELWSGLRTCKSETHLVKRALSTVPKYSGYVRNISALGSKSRNTNLIEHGESPGRFVHKSFDEKFEFWSTVLSVGAIELFSGRVVIHPDDE